MLKAFLFYIDNAREVDLLVTRLGISRRDAIDFLMKSTKVTFKDYFRSYIKQWTPSEVGEEGRILALWEFKFPRQTIILPQKPGKGVSWEGLIR